MKSIEHLINFRGCSKYEPNPHAPLNLLFSGLPPQMVIKKIFKRYGLRLNYWQALHYGYLDGPKWFIIVIYGPRHYCNAAYRIQRWADAFN